METKAFSELFPLFNNANQETLDWLLSVATERDYPASRAVLMEDSWGNAVYFIVSGWVKVRRLSGDSAASDAKRHASALAILGQGDFFGEMAILDESPRSTDVVALSTVELISISAQRFIQALFKDPQLHHRMLQLMVQRLRQSNVRFHLRHQPPAVKLAKMLVTLAENYGQPSDRGTNIFNIPAKDLADVADITVEEAKKILEKLSDKGWVAIDSTRHNLCLMNLKQLTYLAGRIQ